MERTATSSAEVEPLEPRHSASKAPSTPPPTASSGRRANRVAEQIHRGSELVSGVPSDVVLRGASGAEVVDIDGNRYFDFALCEQVLLGHAHPRLVEAASSALTDGLVPQAGLVRANALAEHILAAFPGLRVRFSPSRGQALRDAVDLARRVTGRRRVLTNDLAALPDGEPIPHAPEDLSREQDVAAVILRPITPEVAPLCSKEGGSAWNQAIRDAGALLVVDETGTAFRLGRAGYAQVIGLDPQVTVLGADISGGLPFGALLASADLFTKASLAPSAAHPAAMAAARVTLEELDPGRSYEQLEALGRHFDVRLDALKARFPFLDAARVGSLFRISLREVEASRANQFLARLMDRGILLPPFGGGRGAFSLAHTVDHVERLGDALEMECEALAKAG